MREYLNLRNIGNLTLFIYILVAFLLLNHYDYVFSRFNDMHDNITGEISPAHYLSRVAYIAEFFFATLGLYYITKLKIRYGLPLILIVWILLMIDMTIYDILGRPEDINYIGSMNNAVGNVDDVFMQYKDTILYGFIKSTILIVPLILALIFSKKSKRSYLSYLSIFILFMMYGIILILRGPTSLVGFPTGFAYGFGSTYLAINDLVLSTKTQEKETLQQYNKHTFSKIIVVVDESIEYTEFSKAYQEKIPYSYNFGLAHSGANCSAASNYILRRATWEKSSNNTLNIKEVESLFSLAKKSAYKTIYVDNQNVLNDHSVRNYFTDQEIEYIDTVYDAKEEKYLRDLNSLDSIKKELKNDKVFIFTNKIGAHFPYKSRIPQSLVKADKMENYHTLLEYNVFPYLKRLSEMIDDDTIIFYTSDHGQSFNMSASHCNLSSISTKEEYLVPFIVITKDMNISNLLTSQSSQYKNKLSHIDFSESIRNVMGYELKKKNSIFKENKEKEKEEGFCALYGPPKPLFGRKADCKELEQ